MSPRHRSAKSLVGRPGAVASRKVVMIAAALGLIGLGGGSYWLFAGPDGEALLDAETLTPEQIRAVATTCLLHKDVAVRTKASHKLASAGETAVPVLKEIATSHPDPRMRSAVLAPLKTLDASASLDVLENMVSDDDPAIRQEAVQGAAGIDDPRAVRILERAIEDQNVSIRSAAAASFSGAAAEKSIPKLTGLLSDPDPAVRRHAARSLRSLTGHDYSEQAGIPKAR